MPPPGPHPHPTPLRRCCRRRRCYPDACPRLHPPSFPGVQTIENTRERDETVVQPDDEEVAADEEQDEFAAHFARQRPPHVLLTTCYKPTGRMYKFLKEMLTVCDGGRGGCS